MNKIFNRIIKNTAYLFISKIINKFLFLIFIAIIARYLGVKILGDYLFILSYSELITSFAGFGLGGFVIREIAKEKSKVNLFLGNIIIIRMIGALLTSIIIIISMKLLDDSLIMATSIMLMSLFFLNIFGSLEYIFRAYQIMEFVSITKIIADILTITVAVIFIISGFELIGIMFGYLLGSLISLIFLFLITLKKIPKIKFNLDFKVWNSLFRKGYPFTINQILENGLFKVSPLIIKMFFNSTLVGVYGAAYAIIRGILTFVQLFQNTLYPALSESYIKSKSKLRLLYKKSYFILMIINFIILITLFIFSDKIILILYGDKFYSSILSLKLLSIVGFFLIGNSINKSLLYVVNKEIINMKIMILIFLINLILNLVLVKNYAINGAIIATMISSILLFIITKVYIILKFDFIAK